MRYAISHALPACASPDLHQFVRTGARHDDKARRSDFDTQRAALSHNWSDSAGRVDGTVTYRHEETIRLISVRRARDSEKRQYGDAREGRHEAGDDHG